MAAHNAYFNASVDAAVKVESGMVHINHIAVTHANSSPAWLQMFDAATASAVTLGTTVPDATFPITQAGSGQRGMLLLALHKPIRFPTGLVIAVTTTQNGSTDVTLKAGVVLGRE